MSDKDLRELERRWRESGDTDAEAAYLRARVRANELPIDGLRLAAHLGHPAALALEPGDGPQSWWGPWDRPRLDRWFLALKGWGPETVRRAVLADARWNLSTLRAVVEERHPRDPLMRACVLDARLRIEAAEDWVLDPTKRYRVRADPIITPHAPVGDKYQVILRATSQLITRPPDRWWDMGRRSLTRKQGVKGLRGAIREELVPWALGRSDPLRLRLAHIQVATPCQADWDQMAGDDRVRFCGQCHANVYDLSALTREEADALVRAKEGRMCVRFFERADGTRMTRDCPAAVERLLWPHRQSRRQILGGIA